MQFTISQYFENSKTTSKASSEAISLNIFDDQSFLYIGLRGQCLQNLNKTLTQL